MRLTRIHVPGPLDAGGKITLPPQAGEHLTRVLRLAVGAPFIMFDGRGGEYAGEISSTGKQVRAQVLRHDPVERESPLDLTLLQGVARGERMDLIVQKATELGVARIVPVLTERAVVKLDPKQRERKREHWQSIVVSACEQCGRNRVPAVHDAVSFGDAVNLCPEGATRCLLAADATISLTQAAAHAAGAKLVLLIGPEGGLADSEEKHAQANGFISCRLGPRIMRTETAGLAALAALQAVAGDFSR